MSVAPSRKLLSSPVKVKLSDGSILLKEEILVSPQFQQQAADGSLLSEPLQRGRAPEEAQH